MAPQLGGQPRVCWSSRMRSPPLSASSPSNSRKKEVVLAAVNLFDDPIPEIRRWWTDRGPELLAASRHVREQRSLALYTSAPKRHSPKAERTSRTIEDGTRAGLIQSGFPEYWWPLCAMHWVMNCVGFSVGRDGLAPFQRRHGKGPMFKQYPFRRDGPGQAGPTA